MIMMISIRVVKSVLDRIHHLMIRFCSRKIGVLCHQTKKEEKYADIINRKLQKIDFENSLNRHNFMNRNVIKIDRDSNM